MVGLGKSHEEVVPDQIDLREWQALAVEALEDPIGIVVLVEDDADERQPIGERREETLEVWRIRPRELVRKEASRIEDAARRGGLASVEQREQSFAVASRCRVAMRREQFVE